jgi:hypothetical protein
MAHDDEDLWFVQLSTGAVRAMTLDDLDAAYQSGTIDEDTLVRRDAEKAWMKLGDALGTSEPEPTHTPSVRPVVMEFDADDFAPPVSSKKRVVVGLAVAAAAIALAVFGATKLAGAHAEVNASLANAVKAPELPPSDPQPAQKVTLTEDQKKALADKDAELHQKMNQKRHDRATQVGPTTRTTQPPPFHNSGDMYDPLNSKL